jgi:enoyl-[acyl-carrier protein] reductase II
MGTRFIASTEFSVNEEWKKMVVNVAAEDAVQSEALNPMMPPYNTAEPWHGKERVLRNAFLDSWDGRPGEMTDRAGELGEAMFSAIRAGNGHEYIPFAGQSVGLIADVLPVAQIVRRTIEQAENTLDTPRSFRSSAVS